MTELSITLTLSEDQVGRIVELVAERVYHRVESRRPSATPAPRELSVDEAAAYLGSSTSLIYKMRCDGRLTAHRAGGNGRAWCSREELDLYKAGERRPADALANSRVRLHPHARA